MEVGVQGVRAMTACRYKIGDEVDLHKWDCTVRPPERLHFCVVIGIRRDRCETGWMIKVRSLDRADHREHELDSNWLNETL